MLRRVLDEMKLRYASAGHGAHDPSECAGYKAAARPLRRKLEGLGLEIQECQSVQSRIIITQAFT